jgi:hypothetical protein
LARNRRSPKRPSEPRPSGVRPEEAEVEKDGAAFRLRLGPVRVDVDRLTVEGECWEWQVANPGQVGLPSDGVKGDQNCLLTSRLPT